MNFAEHDEEGNAHGDTMILGFGRKGVCEIHLEVFKEK
ncbi:unnamed protein product, partial [marine sediment metagenome]